MRALCGAISTAGGLIGMGLTAFGIGDRYNGLRMQDSQGNLLHRDKTGDIVEAGSNNSIGVMGMKFSERDQGLTTVLMVLRTGDGIASATTFVGLRNHYD